MLETTNTRRLCIKHRGDELEHLLVHRSSAEVRVDGVADVLRDVDREVTRLRVELLHGRGDAGEVAAGRDGVAVAGAEGEILRAGDL